MGMPSLNLCPFKYTMGLYVHSVIVEQQLYSMHYAKAYGGELRKQKALSHRAAIQVGGETQ